MVFNIPQSPKENLNRIKLPKTTTIGDSNLNLKIKEITKKICSVTKRNIVFCTDRTSANNYLFYL